MEEDLDSILLAGVQTQIGGREIPVSLSLVDEVRQFAESRNGHKPGSNVPTELPFVNQYKPFVQVVRALATEYPYAVLVGDPGVGKTMIIDFITDVIEGKIQPTTLEQISPELAPEFKKIMGRASSFEHRHYLLLPNLKDPMNIETLSYTDSKPFDTDLASAQRFTRDLATILGSYAADHRFNIKLTLTEEEFRQYIKSKVTELYVKIYELVANQTDPIDSPKGKRVQPDFALVKLEPPKDQYTPSTVRGTWQFVEKEARRKGGKTLPISLGRYKTVELSGLAHESRGVDRAVVERALGNNFVFKNAEPVVNNLLWELGMIDVGELTEDQKFAIFKEALVDYTTKVIVPMADSYRGGKMPSQRAMLSELKTQDSGYSAQVKFSGRTIEDIIGKVKVVRDRYASQGISEGLNSWMDSVVSYFETERVALEGTVKLMWDKIREIESKKPPKVAERKKEGTAGKKDNALPEEKPNYSNVRFVLRHGKHVMDIAAIMVVNQFRDTSASKGTTITKVREFSDESLFGTFKEHDEKTPPHMTYATLGTFFKGGILVFPDSFSDFIGAITRGGEKENAPRNMREQVLDYLQSGILTIVRKGISYRLNAPRILIGSDNQDPFITIQGAFLRNEAGLRDRITTVYVPFIADNTAEARRGTLTVLYKALDEFNKRGKTDGQPPIEIDTEAAEMLLRSSTLALDRIVLLEYRGLSKMVDDVCAYARMKKETTITPQLLRQKTLDTLPPAFFLSIDRNINDYGGYVDQPGKRVGAVHAVAVHMGFGQALTGLFGVLQSYFVPSPDRLPANRSRIELVEIESAMTDETMIKGFELAKDYLNRFIAELRRNRQILPVDEGWQLKTEFRDMWGGIGGPSASLAITLSMLSALSGEPIYKNRFVTGTIDPADGDVGPVGGVYYKGLSPTRISELLKLDGIVDPLYLLIPAANLKEITRDIIFDAFNMAGRVAVLPVATVGQAYYLMTCGERITKQQWKDSLEKGKEALAKLPEKIAASYAPKTGTA